MKDYLCPDRTKRRGNAAETLVNGHPRHHDAVTAAALDAADPTLVMRRVATEALTLIPAADGAVVEAAGGCHGSAAGTRGRGTGGDVAGTGALSALARRTGHVQVCADSATDDRVDRAACQRSGIASFVCVPLTRGGADLGVLRLSARTPGVFDADAVALLSRLTRFIADAIGGWSDLACSAAAAMAADGSARADPCPTTARTDGDERVSMFVARVMRPGIVDRNDARRRVLCLLDSAAPIMHLQPIIDLKTSRVAGCEALARFPAGGGRTTENWFEDAERAGLGPDLELAAVRSALRHLPQLPEPSYLAVNVGHQLATSPLLHDLIARAGGHRVVVELTEHLQVDDYPRLIAALDALRATGARLAIDDTGAGFAGFSHILKLAPDLIKLDRVLTTGIDTDTARQALAGALVNFACATGAKVIAEGIETAGELSVVRDLGIDYGQGYHLAGPAPAAQVIGHLVHSTADRVTVRQRRAR